MSVSGLNGGLTLLKGVYLENFQTLGITPCLMDALIIDMNGTANTKDISFWSLWEIHSGLTYSLILILERASLTALTGLVLTPRSLRLFGIRIFGVAHSISRTSRKCKSSEYNIPVCWIWCFSKQFVNFLLAYSFPCQEKELITIKIIAVCVLSFIGAIWWEQKKLRLCAGFLKLSSLSHWDKLYMKPLQHWTIVDEQSNICK